ncbi:MAG: hypothetical protein ACSHXF_16410 [Aquaticitalea sp.]
MTSTIDLICFKCKHWFEFAGGCRAFPDGIPDSILVSNKHNRPIVNQKNDFVYELNTNIDAL